MIYSDLKNNETAHFGETEFAAAFAARIQFASRRL